MSEESSDVSVSCGSIEVATAWLKNPLSAHTIEDQRLLELIKASHAATNGAYGCHRLFKDLREASETCDRLQTARTIQANVFCYIEMLYNPRRRHSHLSDVSPEAFERASTVTC